MAPLHPEPGMRVDDGRMLVAHSPSRPWTGTIVAVSALLLYDHPASTNALEVRLLLDELGLEVERVEVGLDGPRPEGYDAVHPFGLIPALRIDDDLTLTESNTILRYLAETAGRDDHRGLRVGRPRPLPAPPEPSG